MYPSSIGVVPVSIENSSIVFTTWSVVSETLESTRQWIKIVYTNLSDSDDTVVDVDSASKG